MIRNSRKKFLEFLKQWRCEFTPLSNEKDTNSTHSRGQVETPNNNFSFWKALTQIS